MPSGDLVADPTAIAQMRAAVARREPYHGTLRNYRKEGTPFWNALNIRPVFDDLGESDETYRLVGWRAGRARTCGRLPTAASIPTTSPRRRLCSSRRSVRAGVRASTTAWFCPTGPGASCRWKRAFCWMAGRRHVFVRERRTRLDFAAVIKTLCDELYPAAGKIVLVMDPLHTHGVASLYETYPPADARRLAERLEIHHTPKHGGWLNLDKASR